MESNILLVKPDTNNLRWFVDEISQDLRKNGFKIAAIGSKHLSAKEFNDNFICKSDEHCEYMTSDPVVSILYRGKSAITFGRNYKFKFRKQHKIDKLRNILHTSEPGNEFVLQFQLFFSDLNIDDHHQFADQGVYFGNLETTQINQLSKLKSFNLIAASEEEANCQLFKQICNKVNCMYVGIRERTHSDIEILRYRRKAEADQEEAQETRVLLMRETQNYSTNIAKMKQKHEIHSVVCYTPQYSLLETEEIRTAAFDNGLFCVGGSFGRMWPGYIRVSEELVDLFFTQHNLPTLHF